MGRDPPWGVSSLSHTLEALALETYAGKMFPPSLVGRPMGLIGGLWEAWTMLMTNTHMFAYSQDRAERADWNCSGFWPLSHNCSSLHLSLSWVPPLTPLASCCSFILRKGLSQILENSAVRDRGSSDLENGIWSGQGQSLLALIGATLQKWSRCLIMARTATAYTQIQTHSKHLHQPLLLLLQDYSPLGWECWSWGWGENTLRGNRASLDVTLRGSTPASEDLPLPLPPEATGH